MDFFLSLKDFYQKVKAHSKVLEYYFLPQPCESLAECFRDAAVQHVPRQEMNPSLLNRYFEFITWIIMTHSGGKNA